MTMPKAIALLILSIAVMALGIALVVLRVDAGLIDSSISERGSGARSGDNPATPEGASGFSAGRGSAVLTQTAATVTAVSRTAAAALTPISGRTPATEDVVPVPIGEVVAVGNSRYTVHQVVDPEPAGLFTTNPGDRRVAIELTQEAIFGPVSFSFVQFRLRDASGTEHTWAITNSTPRFDSGSLKSGESRRGWISFQLPAGTSLDSLVLQVLGQVRGVPIVSLR